MGKIVEIKDLTFSYGEHVLFNGLSLAIQEKSICTVIGKTGSGKSTLARILMKLEEVSGYIKIDGLFLNPKNEDTIRNRVKFLSENSSSGFITDNVLDEFYFYMQSSLNNLEKEKIIHTISHEFSIEHLLPRKLSQLSAGEKQLISLVVALSSKPRLLILDEALSMIDYNTKKNIWKLLKKYQLENNMTILHFTDCVEDILEGTEIVVLAEGKISLQEETDSALQSDKLFTSNQLEVPFLVDLSNKLRYYNVIASVNTCLEKLVDDIWK